MSTLKSLVLDTLARLRFGTSRPDHVTLPGAPSPVFLNPADRRAVKKLVYDTVRGRTSVPMRFWRSMVEGLQPDLALDIGANYGECFAGALYHAHTRILALEANPTLVPYLEKTRAAHPSVAAMKVINCLVADRPGKGQPFYFDPAWTGGGSALRPDNPAACKQIVVPVDCLDQIVAREFGPGHGRKILLKADVEGYEGMMLRGFESLTEFGQAAGILEFDTQWLAKAGTPAQEVFARLASHFRLFDTIRHQCKLRAVENWSQLTAKRDGDFHSDLVFVTEETALPAGWVVAR